MWNLILEAFRRIAPAQLLAPLHINDEGWLEGENVIRVPSHPSWYYPKLSTPHGDPLAIVAHCSDTPLGTSLVMANKRVKPRRPRLPEHKDSDVDKLFDRAASWHASIDILPIDKVQVPTIVQMAPFHVGCWHAPSLIKGVGSANRTALGFEMIGRVPGPWPEGQVTQAMRLWRTAVQSYGIKRALAMISHSSLDPAHRRDPGAPFMKTCAPVILDHAYAP
jgi:hypothetical protein